MAKKILLVDDDIELTELLAEVLQLEGFEVETVYNGLQALDALNATHDLILLDIMMPELNGIETLKRIRQTYSTPIIMLTARGDDIDRVLGLELGSDDYIAKPFNDRELVARIKAILRRTANANDDASEKSHIDIDEHTQVEFAGVTLYPGRQQAMFGNQDLDLTGTEFALLYTLIKHQGKILSRELLSLEILGKRLAPFDRSIDMHVSNLRKKLPERSDELPWVKTLRGRGYLLVTES
ncbi:response regulator [Pasteurellaceae bacterium TAE3-ERU1]|uniref:response regulator n=1 Tax=Spirabiliibacterium mucosae TaxID=28156 RepID=UPI001AAC4E51|nr:response regulator [Spirabiliibacterium mucosae]MBE2897617.1 response regulator [Spirabiliibacterium mucosae]MBV7388321.1 response regulator [Pasteurellaceae bacterium TAE3-ERU1]